MSLDFTWLDKVNGLDKVALSDRAINSISAAISGLRVETGVFIDSYSDTRLSPDHAYLLYKLIDITCPHKNLEIQKLELMLQLAAERRWWIMVEGD